MKVVGFIGSPRNQGNTARLVAEVMRGAKEAGAETTTHYLNELHIRGCQGCRACKTPEGACIQKDDMTPLCEEIADADGVVIGTPIYFHQVTGQTKLFMDRLYRFLNKDFTHRLGKGKKTVIVFTQGQPNPGAFKLYFETVGAMLALVGLNLQETIVAAGVGKPDDVLRNREAMEAAYGAGKALTRDA